MDGPATETDMETTTDIWGEPATGVMEDSEVSGFLSLVPIYTVLWWFTFVVCKGNGGLTTYYGYGRDDYAGDRNMGFGYQQGTNINGFSRDGDRNLNYNSYPTSASSSDYYY